MANPFESVMEDDIKDLQLFNKEIKDISYDDVASKLINDNLLLTALELHTELFEAGRQVSKLKEFFSNPGNFEQASATRLDSSSSIPRSSSQVTLDSLDLTRYSEDGERGTDERVAVLEFELRKAKETIVGLRANLTVAAESENTTPELGSAKLPTNETIKPHEQRALNFLLNEYLLMHGYKLTSITFADENEHQDFEDWDDVGLNIPKPAELLSLYRDFMRHSGHVRLPCQHVSCQTDPEEPSREDLLDEVQQLKEQVSVLDREKRWTEQSDVTTPGSDPGVVEEPSHEDLLEQIQQLKEQLVLDREKRWTNTERSDVTTPGSDLGVAANETLSTRSASPERFELVDAENKMADDGSVSLADTDNDWTRVVLPIRERESETTVPASPTVPPTALADGVTSRFQLEVFARCCVNEKQISDEMWQEDITEHRLVYILGQSLPRIIPNIILAKREEVLPLVVSTIRLHPDAGERDRLLHLLFNLKKRPQKEERATILAGIVCIARRSGLGLVENEILPQCWEQIGHRHVERRMLVAEACSALAPYVSSPIRNSLMLSMLQQMLTEDVSEAVREAAVRSLAYVVSYVDDADKYGQCEDLAMSALGDASQPVSSAAVRSLLPVLARWALTLDRLTRLSARLLADGRVAALTTLMPHLLVDVVAADVVMETVGADTTAVDRRVGRGLTCPDVFYRGEVPFRSLLGAFHAIVERDDHEEWPRLQWTFGTFLPSLLDAIQTVDVTQEAVVSAFVELFRELCAAFGESVTRTRVTPRFTERLQGLEKNLADGRGSEEAKPSLAIIPVYLVGVLASRPEECPDLGPTLKRFLFGLPLCEAPLTALHITVRGLCERPANRDTVLSALWDAVVHPRPAVRRSAAALLVDTLATVGDALLVAKVVPALVTLASDPDMSVRVAAVPAFAALITHTTHKEVHDKTYMQLQSLLSDPASRDNHAMLVQLVATMGQIVTSAEPWFREEVILPQLAATAAYTSQLPNATKRLDLATILVEAFTNAVYCTLSRHTISTALLPGLRYLEPVSAQSLQAQHHDTVLTMIRSVESRIEVGRPAERSAGPSVEDMKKKVSNMFTNKSGLNRPANLPNLQNIFRSNKK